MASSLVITVKHEETQAYLRQLFQLDTNGPKRLAKELSKHFLRIGSQNMRAIVNVQTAAAAPVAASGTFTLVSVIATDACTVGPVTFTFTSTPSVSTATAQDVEVDGASDTLDAAALAAAINANAVTGAIVYATSALGVVTVTSRTPGLIGNFIAISDADTTIATSAGGYLAGGTGGCTDSTAYTYNFGL